MIIKKISFVFSNFVFHCLAISLLFYTFLPIAKWYVDYRPIWGVDFFLTVAITNMLRGHFVLPYAFWNYAGFAGWPQFRYPSLLAYINAIVSKFNDLIISTQILMMGFSFLFILGCYFLFYVVSRNFVVALSLAVFAGLSGGVYQTLTWAGSLPSYASQTAFPWVLGFLVCYLRTNKIRYLLSAGLVAGISVWLHPLVFIIYILPAITILIFTNFENGLAFFSKIKQFSVFILIAAIISLPQIYPTISANKKSAVQLNYGKEALSTTSSPTQTEIDIANFNKNQVKRAITDNHMGVFALAAALGALLLVSIVISRRIKGVVEVLPYVLLSGYFTFYIWIFGQGISIFHGGWYRLFWSVPVWMGALGSICWFVSYKSVTGVLKTNYMRTGYLIGSSMLIFGLFAFYIWVLPPKITISSIIYRSQVSSAHPDVLNLKISDTDTKALKSKLVPSWMNGDDTNWRFYDADQTVNIWWSSIFKMPLARGYIDPPVDNSNRGFIFLLDSGLSEEQGVPQLVQAFKFPQETAISNTLFLIDWSAVRYFEGGHTGAAFKPVPEYLKQLIVKRDEVLEFNSDRYTKRSVTLHYSEFKDEVTSPILSSTNASTIGIFATDNGFETIVRAIAERNNLNSQVLIPIKLGEYADGYSDSDLKNFDALYLYDYDYKNQGKAFRLVRNFLESGKKVFVETGTEVKETTGVLPDDIFPVKKVIRKGQGKEWNLESAVSDSFLRGVDVKKFTPPDFDGADWSISFADESDLKDGAAAILKNQGKVIMASMKFGRGELIWGGFNQAYHLLREHNGEEAKLFVNTLSSLVDLNKKPGGTYETNFKNANERIIKTSGARAILFKEQAYDGWRAKLVKNDGGKGGKLKIYKAGPAFPGFMYIALPNDANSEVKLTFSGSGADKILIIISIIVVVFLFEEVFFGGITLGRVRKSGWRIFSRKVGSWWQKEDE